MKTVWPQGVVCPCPGATYMYIIIIFKHLLWNRLANQAQILCVSVRSGKEGLYNWYRSNDKDGHHAHIWWKLFKNLLLQNQKSYDLETWHIALGTQALQSLYKWWPWVDLDLFYLFCAYSRPRYQVSVQYLTIWRPPFCKSGNMTKIEKY